jgi:hypothetical protein
MKFIKNQSAFSFIFFISLLLLIVFNINSVMAQTTTENEEVEQPKVKYKVKKKLFRYTNVISVYPLQAISNYMCLGYEFKTGEKTALKTMAGFAQKEGTFLDFNNTNASLTKYAGYKIEMQFKYFINSKATVFNGIYFAPFASYKACSFNYDIGEEVYDPNTGFYRYNTVSKKGKAGAMHLGFLLGYHTKVGESFTIDMYAGEGLMSCSGNYSYGSRLFDTYSNSIRLKLGLNLGFGF